MINNKIKVIALVFVTACILLAQQPFQLQTVNGGGALQLGAGVAAGSLRVELPTDGTGKVGLNAGSAVIGHVIVDSGAITASLAPSTSSGVAFTRFHVATAAAANVKASAGNLYGFIFENNGTIPCYIQFFNNAGTPTAGTSVLDSYMVQAGISEKITPSTFALTNYSTGIAIAGATTDGGATTTGCTTTISITIYYM